MNVSVLVCTFGADRWRRAAMRAMRSAQQQGAHEVLAFHGDAGLELHEVRNGAARAASGDWLCFLDADDQLAPGYVLAMKLEGLAGPGVLYPAVQYVYEDGREAAPAMLGSKRRLIDLNRAVVGSLVPRDLFLEVGGFGPEPIYEDWDLWLRCSQHVALRPVPDAVYRVFMRSRSRNLASNLHRHWYHEIRNRYLEEGVRPGG